MIRYCDLCGQLTWENDACNNPDCKGHKTVPVPGLEDPTRRRPMRLSDRLKEGNHGPKVAKPSQPYGKSWDDDWDDEDWDEEDEEQLPEPGTSGSDYDQRVFLSKRVRSTRSRLSFGRERRADLLWTIVAILASAIGTLIFGAMYLEDFLVRWLVVGVITPMVAFGFSALYGWLLMGSLAGHGEGHAHRMNSLLSGVALSARLPSVLLILSCFLSPLDKNMGVFQFFALLLVITWVVSLYHSLRSAYDGPFSKWTPLFTIAFAFLAFTTLRSLWVWFITGDFRFALYIPLHIFF